MNFLRAIENWWEYSDIAELFRLVLILSAAMVPVVMLLVGISAWSSSRDCHFYSEQTGRATKYYFLSDCYIQDDKGRWWAWSEWKLRGLTKGD